MGLTYGGNSSESGTGTVDLSVNCVISGVMVESGIWLVMPGEPFGVAILGGDVSASGIVILVITIGPSDAVIPAAGSSAVGFVTPLVVL